MNLVIVESPSKAKTINQYLGKDFHVLASFGHIRDLPAKDGSVEPDNDFAMTYVVDAASQKHLKAISDAAKKADVIYLATDPDREGEAISWHILEALQAKKALKDAAVHRVVFHEITKKAVTEAIANPRDLDMNLVNAQQARRALDYLVGFNLSPVLWRKLPGSRSAGRVQSVALRLICEREAEIEAFISQEYWDVKADLLAEGATITARLVEWQGKKLDKFDIPTEKDAKSIENDLKSKAYSVSEVIPKQVKRNPAAPFTTSTLQQEASRKLGFGAKRTMQVAQRLYESGLITYMRTDSVHLSGEAIAGARDVIAKEYGNEYVPKSPRQYTSKAKNAQEAHEAIRPTSPSKLPKNMDLEVDQARLYELIWKRTIASQMESAVLDQLSITFAANDNSAKLRASGSTIKFPGFIALYREGVDDKSDSESENEDDKLLPNLPTGTKADAKKVEAAQHFTEPPPRFSEASLVKKMEELGIGRPSTYASIISVLQDRHYVVLDKKRFIPESRGRLVSAFLASFFERYVQADFTARIEERLDEVSNGERDWKEVLRDFWGRFYENVEEAKAIPMSDVLSMLDEVLEPFLFPRKDDTKTDAATRTCPACHEGRLSLRIGRYGAYVSCSNYPDCTYTRDVSGSATGGGNEGDENTEAAAELPKMLGNDPKTNMDVWLKKGPYGIYVQLGEDVKGEKPKRASLLKEHNVATFTLEDALKLLALPREVGIHPESGKPILAGLGRYGPYLLHDGKYTSLKEDSVMEVGINRAVTIIAEGGKSKTAEPIRKMEDHPDGGEIAIYDGRYGPYVKHGKVNASLPRGADPQALSMEEALALLASKSSAKGKGKAKKKPARKPPAKKK